MNQRPNQALEPTCTSLTLAKKREMRTYIFYFALIVVVANLGYLVGQLGRGEKNLVSLPLLFGSICAAIFALLVVRKRLHRSNATSKKESEHVSE